VSEAGPQTKVAVVIPCFRVKEHVLGVIASIGDEVTLIYAVDDKCPDGSGDFIEAECDDARVKVLRHEVNKGVGGATMTGMQAAIDDGADIIVKLDGDGQMDPSLLPLFIAPLARGEADYAKGNRFYTVEAAASMPVVRLFGNAGLSFLAKLSSGYWNLFDPNNGYVAIHAKVARQLPFDRISQRYFFESDLLFRLGTLQAVVVDVPMLAVYGEEESNLRAHQELFRHGWGHTKNAIKRVFYRYFLRSFSVASIELPLGLMLMIFGAAFGISRWEMTGPPATAGTVMLAGLPVIVGTQLLLAFLNHDIQTVPRIPLHPRLP
jgi:glycosyltransferase involved in cell wall biosynthesis